MMIAPLHTRIARFGDRISLTVFGDSLKAVDTARLRFSSEEKGSGSGDFLSLFIVGGRLAGLAVGFDNNAAELLYETGNTAIYSRDNLRFGDWYGVARSVIALDCGAAVICIPGLHRYNAEFIGRLIIRPLIDRLLQTRGLVTLHGAGVANGVSGLIILGDTGMGKSTLCSGLIEAGYHFMSDDRALVETGASGVFLVSYPEAIRLPKTNRGPKFTVMPPETPCTTLPVGSIVFLDRGEPTSDFSITRIGKAEAAARMMRYLTPFTEPAAVKDCFTRIGDMCGMLPAFCVKGWGDRFRIVEAVGRILDGGFPV